MSSINSSLGKKKTEKLMLPAASPSHFSLPKWFSGNISCITCLQKSDLLLAKWNNISPTQFGLKFSGSPFPSQTLPFGGAQVGSSKELGTSSPEKPSQQKGPNL